MSIKFGKDDWDRIKETYDSWWNRTLERPAIKLTLQQNNDVAEMVCWSETCEAHREEISALKDRIVIVSGMVKYSDYSGTNNLQSTKSTIIHIV